MLSSSTQEKISFPIIQDLTQKEYIFLLSIVTILTYLLYIFIEKKLILFTKKGSKFLMQDKQNTPKLEKISLSAYTTVHQIFSGLIIIFLSFAFILLFYTDLALFSLSITVLLLFIGLQYQCNFFVNTPKNEIVINEISELLNSTFFLLAFGFIIINFLFFTLPNFYIMLISLLICRQIGNQFSKITRGIYKLQKQKKQIIFLINLNLTSINVK